MKRPALAAVLVALASIAASAGALASAGDFSSWSAATRVEDAPGTGPAFNGAALDGCPFISRDGKRFYMASNRTGGLGGIDIWVSTRASVSDPWGAAVNVGAAGNPPADAFSPPVA